MLNSQLASRYQIEEQIGVGGMGVVYRAHDVRLRRDVAIKVIAPHLTQEEVARARFLQEAQALAGLSHPNIVTIYDLAEDPESEAIFIVMELLRGASLRGWMRSDGRPTFAALAAPLCRALAAAHSRSVLHRDIKPENVFVCDDGTVKLMDFGLARMLGSAATNQSSVIAGTVAYMSPEQARGEKLDARSDLYSLGVLFYEYLGGTPPFTADNPGTLLIKHLTENPPPLHDLAPNVPNTVSDAVMRLLEKERTKRFASATELWDVLVPAVSDVPVVLPVSPAPLSPVLTADTQTHAVSPVPAAQTPIATAATIAAPPTRSARRGVPAAVMVSAVLITAVGANLWLRRGPATPLSSSGAAIKIARGGQPVSSPAKELPKSPASQPVAETRKNDNQAAPESAAKTDTSAREAEATAKATREELRELREQVKLLAKLNETRLNEERANEAVRKETAVTEGEAQGAVSQSSRRADVRVSPPAPPVPPDRSPRPGFMPRSRHPMIWAWQQEGNEKQIGVSLRNMEGKDAAYYALDFATGKAVRLDSKTRTMRARGPRGEAAQVQLSMPDGLEIDPERLLVLSGEGEMASLPSSFSLPRPAHMAREAAEAAKKGVSMERLFRDKILRTLQSQGLFAGGADDENLDVRVVRVLSGKRPDANR